MSGQSPIIYQPETGNPSFSGSRLDTCKEWRSWRLLRDLGRFCVTKMDIWDAWLLDVCKETWAATNKGRIQICLHLFRRIILRVQYLWIIFICVGNLMVFISDDLTGFSAGKSTWLTITGIFFCWTLTTQYTMEWYGMIWFKVSERAGIDYLSARKTPSLAMNSLHKTPKLTTIHWLID